MTTLEVSNLGRYGFMGGRGGMSVAGSGQMGHSHSSGTSSPQSQQSSANPSTPHSHSHKGPVAFLLHLLGLDRFFGQSARQSRRGLVEAGTKEGRNKNPFDRGLVGNCRDFWSRGKELGVEYEVLYEVPEGGFGGASSRRRREEDGKGMGLGSLFGRGSGGRGGYQMVRSDEGEGEV